MGGLTIGSGGGVWKSTMPSSSVCSGFELWIAVMYQVEVPIGAVASRRRDVLCGYSAATYPARTGLNAHFCSVKPLVQKRQRGALPATE